MDESEQLYLIELFQFDSLCVILSFAFYVVRRANSKFSPNISTETFLIISKKELWCYQTDKRKFHFCFRLSISLTSLNVWIAGWEIHCCFFTIDLFLIALLMLLILLQIKRMKDNAVFSWNKNYSSWWAFFFFSGC